MAIKKTNPAPVAAKTASPAPVARSEAKGSGNTAPIGRSTAIPTTSPTYQQIAERAYQIYLKRGFGPGNATTDWLEAERQLKAGL